MVMALILKGRSDLQVVKHYTIQDRGVTEEHVRALRRALALEQNAAHAGEESTDLQAGPGVEVCDERPYKVVAVVDGSPADACGQIRVGDVLVSVQGQDVDYKVSICCTSCTCRLTGTHSQPAANLVCLACGIINSRCCTPVDCAGHSVAHERH
jgi:hypothetical protein